MIRSVEVPASSAQLFDARVVSNERICREHYRLVLAGVNISFAKPGQFLQLGPAKRSDNTISDSAEPDVIGTSSAPVPLLRRAFSIAGLRTGPDETCELDVIYRVVGTATTWMASLGQGDAASVIGPLGNAFPISKTKRHAWMVAGGVGLPPMIWLAQALAANQRESVAFVGARSADLVALNISDAGALDRDARRASLAASEFAACNTPVVISTDDGSLGFDGYVASALAAFFENASPPADDIVVYTCGPEPMMQAVARFCIDRSIECYVCVERAMACGMGTCQSCVVAVGDEQASEGWRYELCCTHGPVFDAARVIWSGRSGGSVQH